jgi:hypothetical protein
VGVPRTSGTEETCRRILLKFWQHWRVNFCCVLTVFEYENLRYISAESKPVNSYDWSLCKQLPDENLRTAVAICSQVFYTGGFAVGPR